MKISEKKLLEFILNEAAENHSVNLEEGLTLEYDKDDGISWENVAAYCQNRLVKINERYEKNKEYKIKKQNEKNDYLRNAILDIMAEAEEYMTLNEVHAALVALDDPDVTAQAVGVRLGRLVKEGILESETKTVEGRRLKHYRKAA